MRIGTHWITSMLLLGLPSSFCPFSVGASVQVRAFVNDTVLIPPPPNEGGRRQYRGWPPPVPSSTHRRLFAFHRKKTHDDGDGGGDDDDDEDENAGASWDKNDERTKRTTMTTVDATTDGSGDGGSTTATGSSLGSAHNLMSERNSKKVESEAGQSTAAATFNLIKAAVGSGVLALPSGIAVMSDSPASVIPASFFSAVVAAIGAYTFHSLGRLADSNAAQSLGQLWEKEIGPDSSWIISLATFTFSMGVCLTFSIVIGDSLQSLAASLGATPGLAADGRLGGGNIWSWFLGTRNGAILSTTLVALLPMAQLNSLSALSPISVVGVLGTVATCAFMGWRCFISRAYRLPDGRLLSTVEPRMFPSFAPPNSAGRFRPFATLILGGMTATAYLVHINAPEFLHGLPKDDRRMENYRRMTVHGFAWTALINVAVMGFGFLTFGGNSDFGNILNNYSSLDGGATICRLLMAVNVVGGYPFLLSASRTSFINLLRSGGRRTMRQERRRPRRRRGRSSSRSRGQEQDHGNDMTTSTETITATTWRTPQQQRQEELILVNGGDYTPVCAVAGYDHGDEKEQEQDAVVPVWQKRLVSTSLLAVITATSLRLRDAGVVVSVNGAVMGSAIVYIFPALLFLKNDDALRASGRGGRRKAERWFNYGLVGLGVTAALVGGSVSITNAFAPHLMRPT